MMADGQLHEIDHLAEYRCSMCSFLWLTLSTSLGPWPCPRCKRAVTPEWITLKVVGVPQAWRKAMRQEEKEEEKEKEES
jgi:ribosomal protein L37AE/L43A